VVVLFDICLFVDASSVLAETKDGQDSIEYSSSTAEEAKESEQKDSG
jgi:hypothetical protein